MTAARARVTSLWVTIPLAGTLLLAASACGPDSPAETSDVARTDTGGSDVADIESDTSPFDYCDGQPPDATCFAAARDPGSDTVGVAVAIGDKIINTRVASELSWNWGEAVMLIGMTQLSRVSGDERYLDFVQDYMDHHLSEGVEIQTSDSSAPVALAVGLIAAGRDEPAYREIIGTALEYYREEALRTPEGGISHFGAEEFFGVSLWADSLFMFGNVMTGWGEYSDDAALLDEYTEQFEVFASLMQEESGLFKHAVHSPFGQDDDVYWARANGWVVAAGFDHLRAREIRGEDVTEVRNSALFLVDAVIEAQDAESGLWWTVLNRPGETYTETSATALFAFGLARGWRYGLLGDEVLPVIDAAINGLLSRVEESEDGPTITGISGPTNVGTSDYYASVPRGDDITYGVGAVLLALTESSGLPTTGDER